MPRLEKDRDSELTAPGILNVLIDGYPGVFDLEKFKNLADVLRRRVKKWREGNRRPAPQRNKSAPKSKGKPQPRKDQRKRPASSSARVRKSRPRKRRPGEEVQVDFTHLDGLGITIQGKSEPLVLFVFRLRYSGWTYAEVFQGETLPALIQGLQNALQQLNGVPRRLWRDRHGSSTWNGKPIPPFELVIEHYRLWLSLIPQGSPWMNGGVERGNGVIKTKIKQILLELGTRDFASRQAFQDVVRRAVNWSNRMPEVQHKLAEERNRLSPLPKGQVPTHLEKKAKVGRFGLIVLSGCIYSVPWAAGTNVFVRMYDDRIELHRYDPQHPLSQHREPVVTWPRLHVKASVQIDHRHLLPRISGNPIVFGGLPEEIREAMCPGESFKQTYQKLNVWYMQEAYRIKRRPDIPPGAWISDGHADFEYLCILALATDADHEKEVDEALQRLLENGHPFYYKDVERSMPSPPDAEGRCAVQGLGR